MGIPLEHRLNATGNWLVCSHDFGIISPRKRERSFLLSLHSLRYRLLLGVVTTGFQVLPGEVVGGSGL